MHRRHRHLAALALAAATTLAFVSPLGPLQRSGDQLADGKSLALQAALDVGTSPVLDLPGAQAAFDAALSDLPCTAGFAGPYPCDGLDLAAYLPLAQLGGVAGSDSWGWTDDNGTPDDPSDDREVAIVTTGLGVAYVDVTTPTEATVLGFTEINIDQTPDRVLWRDVKVHDDHALIVAEQGDSGIRVVDLTQLRDVAPGVTGRDATQIEPVARYTGFGNAHNIAVNTETATAYAIGTDTCAGGLHMVDVSTPSAPTFAGCFDADGYTHDVQCVLYDGPDADHVGKELCFASNEDSVTVVDVTDKAAPVQLAKIRYATAAYTHQGWLTPDQRFFVFNDELDEDPVLGAGTVANTTTYMVELADLDDPRWQDDQVGEDNDGVQLYDHDTLSIDHNLYITGDATDGALVWQANYNAGLQVFEASTDGLRAGDLDRVAFFDVDPGQDTPTYGGAWNVYPFFASGTIIVSTLDEGLYVLTPTFVDDPGDDDGEDGDQDGDGDGGPPEDRPGHGRGGPQDRPGERPGGPDDRPGERP